MNRKSKKLLTTWFCLLITTSGFSQSASLLSLDSCYSLARANYPLVKQMALIEKTKEYNLENASKGYLPQINFNAQATYQSEVTQFPIVLPNSNITPLSKDQYKLFAEVNQSLTDGIVIKQQKELLNTNAAIEEEKLETELYKLKEKINNLYFGILLIDAQISQTNLLIKDIESGILKVNALVINGTALKSNILILQAELLKANQRIIELQNNRKGFADMLALFINKPIDKGTVLIFPKTKPIIEKLNRRELTVIELQKSSFLLQKNLITAKVLPRASVFLQTGYGRPALNFLNNNFKFYYIGGFKLNWNLTGFYTIHNDRQMLMLNQDFLNVQKEIFLFNTTLQLKQQNGEINKYQELMVADNQIISIRESLKKTATAQLEFGTISTIDYLNYLTAEDQARQNLAIHQIQLLMAQYTYQNISGN